MRYLGIDYGTKRVGVALSDESGALAFPYAILETSKGLLGEIKNICVQEGVERIVVGESRDYRGEPNQVMAAIDRFVEELSVIAGVPIMLEGEFLSTRQARSSQEDRQHVDDSAAAIILQSYLDKRKHQSRNHSNTL